MCHANRYTLLKTARRYISDMAKVRPAGRMRPLKQIYLGITMFMDIILQVNM
jgi:hypothetical protein